jgi:hypothetical protein
MSPGRSHLLLIVLWAGLLIAFMAVGPPASSALFWLLIGGAIGVGGLYMLAEHRDSSRTQREWREWSRRVAELVDVSDYVEDGHLFESLDDAERQRVVAELARMPAGSRSLRRALQLVCPEMLDDRT